ncbi:MAG: helix-turn-helix domain-containing protein [Oscillospiraceae bacterium]|nr:helix-turn-helix domain-containing protein [Oscillospiraceae bacterium]
MIKRFRMQRGFSQTQLADVLGVSNKAISKWESGSGLPDIAYLVPLADALGVSTDVLLGR